MSSDGGSSALEQFVILAKSTTKGSTAALIQQVRTPPGGAHPTRSVRGWLTAQSPRAHPKVLSNRKIFVFGELMAMPSLQAVSVVRFTWSWTG